MSIMVGQGDLLELLGMDSEPAILPVDVDLLTGFTMSERDPDKLDAIAVAWREAYRGTERPEWRMFHGWHESMTGRNAYGTPHASFIYTADLRCDHWKETLAANRATYCQCVGKWLYYRAYCAGCEWWTDVFDSENDAAESILDHCWPGWRDLPVIEGKMSPKFGYDFIFPKDYPAEWKVPGAPQRDCRGLSKHGTRHVPSGSQWGGYKTAVTQECRHHDKQGT